MLNNPADKKLAALLLVYCVFLLAGSAESKEHNRVFSGQVVNSSNHGVQGVVVHLRPQNAATDQKDVAGTEAAGKAAQCPPVELCQTTAHNGNFSFHQVKTGLYDLAVYKDGQVIYTKPEPLLIPQMPDSTHLVISLPQPTQN